MSNLTLKAWDAINGAMGKCVAAIDGKVEDMIYVKNISAKIDKNKSEIKYSDRRERKIRRTSGKAQAS